MASLVTRGDNNNEEEDEEEDEEEEEEEEEEEGVLVTFLDVLSDSIAVGDTKRVEETAAETGVVDVLVEPTTFFVGDALEGEGPVVRSSAIFGRGDCDALIVAGDAAVFFTGEVG